MYNEWSLAFQTRTKVQMCERQKFYALFGLTIETFLVENAQNVEDGNGKRKSSLRKRFFGNFQRLSETTEGGEDDNSSINEENSIEPKILSDEELLHKYWKLVVSSFA